MDSALHVFSGPEAEVEASGEQVGDGVGSGVRGGSCLGNDGVHNSQGDGLLSSDEGIFKPVGLELPREAPLCALGVGRFSWSGQNIQEVGCCNLSPCLRKPILSQVGSYGAWSTWRSELGGRSPHILSPPSTITSHMDLSANREGRSPQGE